MSFLGRIFGIKPDDPPETPAVDLQKHLVLLAEMEASVQKLKQLQGDPITARVRGQYPVKRTPKEQTT